MLHPAINHAMHLAIIKMYMIDQGIFGYLSFDVHLKLDVNTALHNSIN